MKHKNVILELYMEIWYCYKDGESMATPLFTTTEYLEACRICDKRGYNVIQTIDLELQEEEEPAAPLPYTGEMEATKLRQDALKWWNELESPVKLEYWREYSQFSPSHSPDELTGREIQNIWAVKINPPIKPYTGEGLRMAELLAENEKLKHQVKMLREVATWAKGQLCSLRYSYKPGQIAYNETTEIMKDITEALNNTVS
jgi:hypothetical protein